MDLEPRFVLSKEMAQASKDKILYIIRHGETEFNRQGIIQGSLIDAPLNETGRKQAERFHAFFKEEGFDAIYTSNLVRTHQSIAPFLQEGYKHTSLEGLNEISWGVTEGKVPDNAQNRIFYNLLKDWRHGLLKRSMPEGESPLEVLDRQIVAMNTILAKTQEKRVLICMHGRAMRVLLCYLTGKSLVKMDEFAHKNLCLYKLRFNGTVFEIEIKNFSVPEN